MTYEVIALSVGGKGNKIFKFGEIVTEAQFPNGNAAELVEKGFLKAVKEPVSEPEKDPAKEEAEAKAKAAAEKAAKEKAAKEKADADKAAKSSANKK